MMTDDQEYSRRLESWIVCRIRKKIISSLKDLSEHKQKHCRQNIQCLGMDNEKGDNHATKSEFGQGSS